MLDRCKVCGFPLLYGKRPSPCTHPAAPHDNPADAPLTVEEAPATVQEQPSDPSGSRVPAQAETPSRTRRKTY